MLSDEDLLKEIREVARSVYENERLAVLAEREACARVCEELRGDGRKQSRGDTAKALAAAIRARKEKE